MKRIITICLSLLTILMFAAVAKAAPVDSAFSVNLDPNQWSSYTFEAEVGESVSKQIVLSNHRSYAILIKTRFSPTDLASHFQAPATIQLPANGTASFTLTFTGEQTAPSEIYVGLFVEGDDGSGAGIPVRARTILSMLSLPKSIQFATTKLGGSDCIKLDLTNENKTSMTIKSIDFENADGTRSFTVSNAADITTIDGKKAVSAQICFSPTSAAYSYTDRLRVFYTLDKSDNLYSANAAVIGLLPADEQPNYPDTGKPFIGDCLQIREHPTEVVMGGQILDEIRITNVTSSDLTVSATVSGTDANRFTLSKPEFTVPANSTVLFPYAFDGSDLGTFTFNSPAMGFSGNIDCKISGSSQCSSASFHLFGTVLFPPEKQTWKYEIVLPLFPPTETKILLGSNVPMDHEYIVTLYNNLGTKVKIVDYKMSKGEHYEITGGIAKGTIIKPQEQFKISLWGYQGGDPSITDDLLISTENALKTQRFSFVDPNAAAAVSASSDGKPTLLITPNPMQSQVEFTLRNAQAADLIIINELGQEIYHLHSITSQWSWNGKTDAGSEASAGSYVVAIKGSDETGKPFSQTVMLIKQ